MVLGKIQCFEEFPGYFFDVWVFLLAPIFFVNLRELVLVHDRNPESMRTVPRVCAAGHDSVSGGSGA